MNAWMGFGISKYYQEFSKDLTDKIKNLNFDKYFFLIADEMQKKYNGTLNEELVEKIKKNLLRIPNSKLISSSQLKMEILLPYVQKIYEKDNCFRNEVNAVVIQNRNVSRQEDLRQLAGYVLEEIALTVYFCERDYVKIGPKEKENLFDNISQKYFNISKEKFQYI